VDFDLTITVMYNQNTSPNVTTIQNGTIAAIHNGTVDQMLSHCDGMMVITNFLPDWQLWLNFTQTNNKFALSEMKLTFNLKNSSVFVNASNPASQTTLTTGLQKWQATVGHSYKCVRQELLQPNMTGIVGVNQLYLYFDHIQVQPFINSTTSGQFGDAESCSNETSDIVPIAVGCALAALVVIVLIAYVIGRRRNRARGYESM